MPAHNSELAPLYNLLGLSSNYPLSSLIDTVQDCKRRADSKPVEAWIECQAKLPALDTPVWIHLPEGQIIVAERASSTDGWMWAACYGHYFSEGKWETADNAVDDEPTHWQPLPTPPTELVEQVKP